MSNCELVNFIYHLLNHLDWNKFGFKEDAPEQNNNQSEEVKSNVLSGGHIYKLHGDMDHNERKKNYFGFDKAD